MCVESSKEQMQQDVNSQWVIEYMGCEGAGTLYFLTFKFLKRLVNQEIGFRSELGLN